MKELQNIVLLSFPNNFEKIEAGGQRKTFKMVKLHEHLFEILTSFALYHVLPWRSGRLKPMIKTSDS